MNAPANIKLDEIRTFMGPIPDDEYERRAKMRSYRNAATAMIATTPSDTARLLAWKAIEWISPNLYAPAPVEWLEKINHLVSRLLHTAMTADELDRILIEAATDA